MVCQWFVFFSASLMALESGTDRKQGGLWGMEPSSTAF